MFVAFVQHHELMYQRGECRDTSSMPAASNVITQPEPCLPAPCLQRICRRFPASVPLPSLVTELRDIVRCNTSIVNHSRDVSYLQMEWKNYLRYVRETCCQDFWKFFLPMHALSRVAVDTALRSARATFQHPFKMFPMSTRTLFGKIKSIVRKHYVRIHA